MKLSDGSRPRIPQRIKDNEVANAHYVHLCGLIEEKGDRNLTKEDLLLIEQAATTYAQIVVMNQSIEDDGMMVMIKDKETGVMYSSGKRNPLLPELKGAKSSYLQFLQELNLTFKSAKVGDESGPAPTKERNPFQKPR